MEALKPQETLHAKYTHHLMICKVYGATNSISVVYKEKTSIALSFEKSEWSLFILQEKSLMDTYQ